jgi:uncharacterized protein YecE (DUF72 family)
MITWPCNLSVPQSSVVSRRSTSDARDGYDDWRGRLYPAGEPRRRWLCLYAERFDTVEVNTTFYRLPKRESVAAWVTDTPSSFVFAVKASRYLTHIKVLWQLPANFHRDNGRLARWLEALPPGRHTIEFRHPSWFTAAVMGALREHGVALTIGDHPERPFQTHAATTDWRFVRLHFGHRGRGGNYSASELDTWSRRIAQWRRTTDVYVYFNNDWCGYAPANAHGLADRLRL